MELNGGRKERQRAAVAVAMVTDGMESEKRSERAKGKHGRQNKREREGVMESTGHSVSISLSSKCSPAFTLRLSC